jgi:hypothetical protein
MTLVAKGHEGAGKQGSNFTKALKAIAIVHSFFAIDSDGNLN